MLTEKIIEDFIKSIPTILDKASEIGFSHLRIFKPLMQSEQDKLHFLVKKEDENIDLFDIAKLELYIANTLHYDEKIIVLTENELDQQGKEKIIGSVMPIYLNNIQEIADFCKSELIHKSSFSNISAVTHTAIQGYGFWQTNSSNNITHTATQEFNPLKFQQEM